MTFELFYYYYYFFVNPFFPYIYIYIYINIIIQHQTAINKPNTTGTKIFVKRCFKTFTELSSSVIIKANAMSYVIVYKQYSIFFSFFKEYVM